jgi:hypothetical protein
MSAPSPSSTAVNQIVLAAPVLPEIFIINVEKMAFPPAVFTPLTPAPPLFPERSPTLWMPPPRPKLTIATMPSHCVSFSF